MSISAPELFEGPRELLRWAGEDVDELKTRWQRYLALKPYRSIVDFDRKTGHHECKLRVRTAPPDGLAKLAHNAGNAIRHSFDQALAAAIRGVGHTIAGDVFFPFATGPSDLEGKLRTLDRKIEPSPLPDSAKAVLRAFKPYNTGDDHPGGDDVLRNFAKAIGPSKHRLAIEIAPILQPSNIRAHFEEGEIVDIFVDIFHSARIASKGDHPVAHIIGDKPDRAWNFDVSLAVLYGDGSAVSGYPVIETLSHAAARAENLIDRLEALVREHHAPSP